MSLSLGEISSSVDASSSEAPLSSEATPVAQRMIAWQQLSIVSREGVLRLHNPSNGVVHVRLLDLFGKELRSVHLSAGGDASWGWAELGSRLLFVVSRDSEGISRAQRVVGSPE